MNPEAEPGQQCPHGFPLHVMTECPDCQKNKEGSDIEDLTAEVIEEDNGSTSPESLQSASEKSTSSTKSAETTGAIASVEMQKELNGEKKERDPQEIIPSVEFRLSQLDYLISSSIEKKEKIDEVKEELRDVMADIHDLYYSLDPLDSANDETYDRLKDQMVKTLSLKRSADEITSEAFSEIFYEFSDFIDDALVMDYIKTKRAENIRVSVEHATQELYGRSKEEIERIKSTNREVVVDKIEELTEKPYFTIEDIEELHALNNKGVVPKEFSKIRRNKGENVVFGKRIGLLPRDVVPAMQEVVDNMNNLFDQRALGMSKTLFEVKAAKLHNDMLDIHPFRDRNGSTSLLVLEAMMAREGYKPPKKRDKDYYRMLRRTVNNNAVAVSAVGYEQYLIKYQPGYFASGEIISDKEKKDFYEQLIDKINKARKAEEKKK